MRQSGQPTVEEILESIKKVIARDNRASASEERRQRETDGVREAGDGSAGRDDDVLDLADAAFDADEGHDDGGDDFAPLLTGSAEESMRESLAALAMLAEPGARPQIVRSGETSLEGLVRELLRPALAEWLDRNLPPLVERLVAAEIARIVGKRG